MGGAKRSFQEAPPCRTFLFFARRCLRVFVFGSALERENKGCHKGKQAEDGAVDRGACGPVAQRTWLCRGMCGLFFGSALFLDCCCWNHKTICCFVMVCWQFVDSFRENDINGVVLTELSEETLTELNVPADMHPDFLLKVCSSARPSLTQRSRGRERG